MDRGLRSNVGGSLRQRPAPGCSRASAQLALLSSKRLRAPPAQASRDAEPAGTSGLLLASGLASLLLLGSTPALASDIELLPGPVAVLPSSVFEQELSTQVFQQAELEQAPALVEELMSTLQGGLTALAESPNLADSPISSLGSPAGAVHIASPPSGWCAWGAYCEALDAHPLATKVATGVMGAFLGDLLAQLTALQAEQESEEEQGRRLLGRYDPLRAARLAAFSATVGTPLGHYWFAFLDATVFPDSPTCLAAVALKLLLDQGMMSPVGMALFLGSMKVAEGRAHDVPAELKAKLWPSMRANWMVWPLAQAVNFTVVPPEQRILFVNVLSILWTAFMSTVANEPVPEATGVQPQQAVAPVRAQRRHRQSVARG